MLEAIRTELKTLKGAPFSAFVLLCLGAAVSYFGVSALRQQQIETLNTQLALRDDQLKYKEGQLDDYKRLILERLNKVEKVLDDNKLSALKSAIEKNPASVKISTSNESDVSKQIINAFRTSGWSVKSETSQAAESFVLRATDNNSAEAVANGLRAAGVPFEKVPSYADGPTDFVLKVAP